MRIRKFTRLSSFAVSCAICFVLFVLLPDSGNDSYKRTSLDFHNDPFGSVYKMNSGNQTSPCSRKNILLLIADDLRPQLSMYQGEDYPEPLNNPAIYTPNLDLLGSQSLLLKRAYAQWSSCGPSRTSFLTGRRPYTTKVWDLHSSWRDNGGNFTSLPQYFKENGYVTAGAGKVYHPLEGQVGTDPLSWSLPFYEPSNLALWSRVSTVGVSWKAVTKKERKQSPLEDEQSTEHTLKLLNQLAPKARTCEQPFFIITGFHKPHLPFVFPEEFLDLYPLSKVRSPDNPYAPQNMPDIAWDDFIEVRRYLDVKKLHNRGGINETLPSQTLKQLRRAYYASVSFVDNLVGQIMRQLKRLSLEDNTVVAFLGDHGFSLGENGEFGKHTNFEQALHVPMMVSIPGLTDNGVQTRTITELVDLFPTLVDAAGLGTIPVCPEISTNVSVCTEGRSLLPLISEPDVDRTRMAFSQHKRNNLRMGYTVRTDRYRYTEWIQLSRTFSSYERWDFHNNWHSILGAELYDHLTDPVENVNLATDHKYHRIMELFSDALHKHFKSTVYNFPRNTKSLFFDY